LAHFLLRRFSISAGQHGNISAKSRPADRCNHTVERGEK
jgi:hypothetical protein